MFEEFLFFDFLLGFVVEYELVIFIESLWVFIFFDIGCLEVDFGGINVIFRLEDVGVFDGRWLYFLGVVDDSFCEM